MFWVFVVLTTLMVVAMALVAVGAVTEDLAVQPARSVFDLEEAVEFVSERLSFETTATMSYEEVEQVLRWHLNFLHGRGLELDGTPITEVDQDVLIHEDDALAFVLGQADEHDVELEPAHAVEVVDAQMVYLEAIGAVGYEAPPDIGSE